MNNHLDTPNTNNTNNLNASSAKNDQRGDRKMANTSSEFNSFVTDIEHLIAQTTSLNGADLAKVKEQINQRISQAKQTMDKLGTSIVHRAKQSAQVTNAYVHEQPWVAIGASAAVGLVLGLILSRRQNRNA